MWVDYRGPLSTVYSDEEISTCTVHTQMTNISKLPETHLNMLVGFGCEDASQVRISHFSSWI